MKGVKKLKEFQALVLSHYDFISKDNNKKYTGTKYLVSLGEFGSVEANGPIENSLNELSVVKVKLVYDHNKFRVSEVIK